MRTSMLLALGAASTVAGSGTTTTTPSTCNNAVFTGSGMFGAPTLTLASAPQKYPTTSGSASSLPCRAYAGKDVCCSNETLTEIDSIFAIGQAALDAAAQAIEDNNYPDQLATAITTQMDLLCNTLEKSLFPSLASACQDATTVVSTYTKILANDAKAVLEAELNCANALTAYYKGVLCFACEPNWADYVQDTTAFLLSTSTCDGIVNGCAPVNTAVITVAKDAVTFAEDMLSALTGGSWPSFALDVNTLVDNLPDACGGTLGSPGDCAQFYCNSSAVSGVGTPTQSNWGMTDDSSSSSSTAVEAQASSSTQNVYSANGYDAYTVGAYDMNNPMPGWAIFLVILAVAVAVVGVVAGVVMVKRRRGAARSTSDAHAPFVPATAATYGATSGQQP